MDTPNVDRTFLASREFGLTDETGLESEALGRNARPSRNATAMNREASLRRVKRFMGAS